MGLDHDNDEMPRTYFAPRVKSTNETIAKRHKQDTWRDLHSAFLAPHEEHDPNPQITDCKGTELADK